MSEDSGSTCSLARRGKGGARRGERLDLHQSAAIPVRDDCEKGDGKRYGWEDSYPAEVAAWCARADVSDAIIWTDTAEAFDWVMDAFNARVRIFTAKTYLAGEKGFHLSLRSSPAERRAKGC